MLGLKLNHVSKRSPRYDGRYDQLTVTTRMLQAYRDIGDTRFHARYMSINTIITNNVGLKCQLKHEYVLL